MRSFWGYCSNGKFSVGCNGASVYILDNEGGELARFKGLRGAYTASFLPNSNTVVVKTTEGSLLVFSLDDMVLINRIVITKIGAQDEGFAFSLDGQYLYNIEKPWNSCRTQLTIYKTANWEVVDVLFDTDEHMHLKNIEFDNLTGKCYILGFMRDVTGVYDYGFVGEMIDKRIGTIKKLDKWTYDYTSAYKDWERRGFTKKKYEWGTMQEASEVIPISLQEVFKGNYRIPSKKPQERGKLFEEMLASYKAWKDELAGFSLQKLVAPIEEASQALRVVRLIQLDGENRAGDLVGSIKCIKQACEKLTGFADIMVTSGGFLSVGMESKGVGTSNNSNMDQFEFYSALTREHILKELVWIQPVLEEKVSYLSIGVMMSAPNARSKSADGSIEQPHVEMVGVYGVREKGFVCWTGTSFASRLQKKGLLACIDMKTHVTKLKGHKVLVLGNHDVASFEPITKEPKEDEQTIFANRMREGLVKLLEEERPEVILHHASNSALAQLLIPAMNCVREKYSWVKTFVSGFRYVTRFIELGQVGAEELISQTRFGEIEDLIVDCSGTPQN